MSSVLVFLCIQLDVFSWTDHAYLFRYVIVFSYTENSILQDEMVH